MVAALRGCPLPFSMTASLATITSGSAIAARTMSSGIENTATIPPCFRRAAKVSAVSRSPVAAHSRSG